MTSLSSKDNFANGLQGTGTIPLASLSTRNVSSPEYYFRRVVFQREYAGKRVTQRFPATGSLQAKGLHLPFDPAGLIP